MAKIGELAMSRPVSVVYATAAGVANFSDIRTLSNDIGVPWWLGPASAVFLLMLAGLCWLLWDIKRNDKTGKRVKYLESTLPLRIKVALPLYTALVIGIVLVGQHRFLVAATSRPGVEQRARALMLAREADLSDSHQLQRLLSALLAAIDSTKPSRGSVRIDVAVPDDLQSPAELLVRRGLHQGFEPNEYQVLEARRFEVDPFGTGSGRGFAGGVFITGGWLLVGDVAVRSRADGHTWREFDDQIKTRSIVCVAIEHADGSRSGVVNLSSPRSNWLSPHDAGFIREVADSLSRNKSWRVALASAGNP